MRMSHGPPGCCSPKGLSPCQRSDPILTRPRHQPGPAAAPPPGWKIPCGSEEGRPSWPLSHQSSVAWPHTRPQTGIFPVPEIHPPGTASGKETQAPLSSQIHFIRTDLTPLPNPKLCEGRLKCPVHSSVPTPGHGVWPPASEEQLILAAGMKEGGRGREGVPHLLLQWVTGEYNLTCLFN